MSSRKPESAAATATATARKNKDHDDDGPQKKRYRGDSTWPTAAKTTTATKVVSSSLLGWDDCTASIGAPEFASARLPEMQALIMSSLTSMSSPSTMQSIQRLKPFDYDFPNKHANSTKGRPTTSRHLRRRATSFRPSPRRRHRYPKQAPPQKEQLPQQQAEKGQDDVSSHVNVPIGKEAVVDSKPTPQTSASALPVLSKTKKKSRRAQRAKKQQLVAFHSSWWYTGSDHPEQQQHSPPFDSNSNVNRDGFSWIPTHLWHVKRFHMESLWGWKVPVQHMNRGAQAALRLARGNNKNNHNTSTAKLSAPTGQSYCLAQDVSWKMQPLLTIVSCCSNDDGGSNNDNNAPPPFPQEQQSILTCIIPDLVLPDHNIHDHSSLPSSPSMAFASTGHGMWYAHPHQTTMGAAIGPVSWIISNLPLLPMTTTTTKTTTEPQSNSNPTMAMTTTTTTATTITTTTHHGTHKSTQQTQKWMIYLMVHPSIRQVCLDSWMEQQEQQQQQQWSLKNTATTAGCGGWSYVSLRGGIESSQACLMQALQTLKISPIKLSQLKTELNASTHPSAVVLDISECSNHDNGDDKDYDINNDQNKNDNDINDTTTILLTILTVHHPAHQKNALSTNNITSLADHSCNAGVTGLDLVLSSSQASAAAAVAPVASKLWHALIVHGGACPMGLNDQVHLQLECHPPLPVFPRDYPDTYTGQAYWRGNDGDGDNQQEQQKQHKEWQLLRQYWEGGLGRISLTKQPSLAKTNWQDLVLLDGGDDGKNDNGAPWSGTSFDTTLSASSHDTHVMAMIRGVFVKPIFDLLDIINSTQAKEGVTSTMYLNQAGDDDPDPSASSSSLGTHDVPAKAQPRKRCRRRRPTQNPTDIIYLSSPSREQRDRFQVQCYALLQSLTMPGALLLAHVRVEGKGSIWPGAPLYFCGRSVDDNNTTTNNNDNILLLLGYVTSSGVFSPNRGRCHGMAVVGARRFLQALWMSSGGIDGARKRMHPSSSPSSPPHQQESTGLVAAREFGTDEYRTTRLLVRFRTPCQQQPPLPLCAGCENNSRNKTSNNKANDNNNHQCWYQASLSLCL